MDNPISVPEALDHLRLPTDDITTPEYIELETMVGTATEWAESFCKRVWRSGTKSILFDKFPPSSGRFLLSGGSASSVDSLTYYDTDYVQQTMDAGDYRLVVDREISYLYTAMGGDWPTDACSEPKHIEISYTFTPVVVPSSVKSAILLVVGSLYENREQGTISSGLTLVKAPIAAENLLYPYKLKYSQ